MTMGDDARWTALVGRSGVIDGARLRGIGISALRMPNAPEDVILCPSDDAAMRLERLRTCPPARRAIQAERMFIARSLSSDPSTAAAMIVRAVVSNWVAMRGHKRIYDEHERRAVAMAESQLAARGIACADDISSAERQITRSHLQAPVAHGEPADVVRKAVDQFARQIGDRHVILLGDGPMAH